MNVVQMLNVWRWFTKETFMPLLDDEIEYPTWFWGDDRSAGFSYIDTDSQIMRESISCGLFALDYRDKFPAYFILDKTQTFISDYRDYEDEKTYRSWLTNEENEKLYEESEKKK